MRQKVDSTYKPAVDRLKPGDVLLRRYRIDRLVGRGGMGEVYEASDLELGQTVALKTVLAKLLGSRKTIARFQREIELSRRISHPNVLRIIDVFEVPADHGGPSAASPCMVMEFLEGETLADRLGRGERVDSGTARLLVIQVARALAAAHQAEVVHRDLKPDNIHLVLQDSGETRVVLTDFGVARPNSPGRRELFTATDVIMGTPTYMSPEQLELEEASPASDLYSLGLVMYEMLTGRFPFEGATTLQVVTKRIQEDPIPPRRYVPDLDDRWEFLILRCLDRHPRQRLSDAREIISILDGDPG